MRNLNAFIEQTDTPGFATFENAQRKVALILGRAAKDEVMTESYVIMQRQRDGRYVIVILNPDIAPIWWVNQGCIVWG